MSRTPGEPMASHDSWTKTAFPLALAVACAIPLSLAIAMARSARVARDASKERGDLRKAIARHNQAAALAENAHALALADHERFRATLAEVDQRTEAERAATIARLEAEYATSRAREVADYYAQGVADGEAGIWRLPEGNLVNLAERRRGAPPPPTGSAQS